MDFESIKKLALKDNLKISYREYKGVSNVLFLNDLAIAYNTINSDGKFYLETTLENFPKSCTNTYIRDSLSTNSDDLGYIKKINWQNFQDKTFVVADIETTGFSPKAGGRIIEIGAIKIDEQGNEIDTFHEYVNPFLKVPEKITELTGITNEQVENADSIGIVLRKFVQFFKGSTVVFHNAEFDWYRYIIPEVANLGLIIPNNYPCIDTLLLSKEHSPNEKKHDLETVCNRFNIEIKDHHNAFADVRMTSKFFIEFRNYFKNKFEHLPYTKWNFIKPQYNIKVLSVRRWDKYMPRKKKYSEIRFYVNFVCNGIGGVAFYDYIKKSWFCKSYNGSFDVAELESYVFQYLNITKYEDLLTINFN